MKNEKSKILKEILEKKIFSEELTKKLEEAIKEFISTFTV